MRTRVAGLNASLNGQSSTGLVAKFPKEPQLDVWEAMRVLLRRWWVVVPLLLITVLFALRLSERVQPEYSASATLVMLAPYRTNGETGVATSNPFLNFSGSLTTTAYVIQSALDRDEVRLQVAREGFASNYNVGPETRGTQGDVRSTPLVVVSVTTDAPGQATATVNRVVELFQAELRTRQAALGTPRDETITSQVIAPAVRAISSGSGGKRVLYTVSALGLLAAALAALAVDAAIVRLTAHRARRLAAKAAAWPKSLQSPTQANVGRLKSMKTRFATRKARWLPAKGAARREPLESPPQTDVGRVESTR